jgi:hypothetical protein
VWRGREGDRIEPRAVTASYDGERDLVTVELANGCWFGFPPGASRALDNATPAQLAKVEVYPGGSGLRWEELDADISLVGIMARLLNLQEWARWQLDGHVRKPPADGAASIGVTRPEAEQIAAAHAGGKSIREVRQLHELTAAAPNVYGLRVPLAECWIAYVDRVPAILGPSQVVLVDRRTGEVVYAGSAQDEG